MRAIATIDNARWNLQQHDAGSMTIKCTKCNAFRFQAEKATICCHNGKFNPEAISIDLEPHPDLINLFEGVTPESKDFLLNIRKYNQAFAFTSVRTKLDHNLASDRDGVYTFRVNGQLSNRIGAMNAHEGQQPVFAQIYFLDPSMQTEARIGVLTTPTR